MGFSTRNLTNRAYLLSIGKGKGCPCAAAGQLVAGRTQFASLFVLFGVSAVITS